MQTSCASLEKYQPRTWVLLLLSLLLQGISVAMGQTLSGGQKYYPVNNPKEMILLNGNWNFQYLGRSSMKGYETFFLPEYNDSQWQQIQVPGNWEALGIKTPEYGTIQEVKGLYRTRFTLPEGWANSRVILRFEGVALGYTVWVNGIEVGTWESAFNPCQFDITPYLQNNAENTLAVQVYTHFKGWEFDTNDDWIFSGIERDVKLFRVPEVYLEDLTLTTTIAANNSAELRLAYLLNHYLNQNPSGIALNGVLYDPDGKAVARFSEPWARINANAPAIKTIRVNNAKLWNAETPHLYHLDLFVCRGKDTLQRFAQKVGLREITIDGLVVKLNGSPVKFRGVARNEIHPESGRVLTRQQMLQDLELMKQANINMVRTAHYPPCKEFLNLCDSLGMYVIDEIPFGFGDNLLYDPTYQNILLNRAQATIMRDKNQTSVIIWSIGNENQFTPICNETGKYVKKLDPTRPICFPMYPGSTDNLPDYVDIFATHYPNEKELLQFIKTAKRPYITTEYSHSLGLAFETQHQIWDIIEQNESVSGGCIWLWNDQAVIRKGSLSLPDSKTNHLWISDSAYYDMNGNQGADGIVYPDRSFQTDYFEVRKNYAQVAISEKQWVVKQGSQDIMLTIKNRYDFVNLSEKVTGHWLLTKDRDTLQRGTFTPRCEPGEEVKQWLELTIPDAPEKNIYLLHIRFLDAKERNLNDCVVELVPASKRIPFSEQIPVAPSSLKVDTQTGKIHLLPDAGESQSLLEGPFLKIGRKITMAEQNQRGLNPFVKYLSESNSLSSPKSEPGKAFRAVYHFMADTIPVEGEIEFLPEPTGWINVSFHLASTLDSQRSILEGGLAFLLDKSLTEFRWIGDGPFHSYPGKTALNEFGMHYLPSGDLFLPGNHSGVDMALATDKSGNGFILLSNRANIDIDMTDRGTVLSYNSLVSGRGTKLGRSNTLFTLNRETVIKGSFKMRLITQNDWQGLLRNLFGDPEITKTPYKPYRATYDEYTAPFEEIMF